jgi:diguanylate cyclase (GGDEF)-like protein
VYLACGLAVTGCYPLLPTGGPRDALYGLIGLSCVLAIAVGVRRHAPQRRLAWLLMLVGQLLWSIGDDLGSWLQDIQHSDAFPSAADAFYLVAYPVLGVALVVLIHGRRARGDIAGLLDSATLTVGLGLLSWVLLARPTIDAAQDSLGAAAVGAAYPLADILLVGLLIRLVTTPGGRTVSFRLLLLAILLLVAGDTASAALSLWASGNSYAYDMIWLASYVAWGAAALHPSMAVLSEPALDAEVSFTRRRLVALLAASMIAPVTLIVEELIDDHLDLWAVCAGSVVIFLLVVGRMNVAITQIVSANRERERLQSNLAHQAAHDPLTDLPNRAQALESITAALSRAQRSGVMVGLLFVDLDGFKGVNDSFGHGAGDDVLRVVAARLRERSRGGDLVARLGGDEFVVVLENVKDEANAVHLGQRIVKALGEPITADGKRTRIGASVGLAISQDGSIDADRLIREADAAVYRAKRLGRNRVEVFDAALRRELAERHELQTALQSAIVNDELVLYYQPILGVDSGEVLGLEALVRWQRPGVGLVPPNDFIPAAETSTLICDLDVWVLRRATAQLAEWLALASPTRRPDLTVAVNISGRHIAESRIVDDVRQALADSGLPADRLVLEITETVLAEDLLAIEHLCTLREMGIRVSIDDFGTGYNSVGRLQQLPFDLIKIDRSYLDISTERSRTLLELMITTAHAFGVPAIVEGVERPAQLEALRAIGCEAVQGFHLARPMPAEEVVALVPALARGGAVVRAKVLSQREHRASDATRMVERPGQGS